MRKDNLKASSLFPECFERQMVIESLWKTWWIQEIMWSYMSSPVWRGAINKRLRLIDEAPGGRGPEGWRH